MLSRSWGRLDNGAGSARGGTVARTSRTNSSLLINASETCFLDAEYNWLATHKVTVAVSPRLNHLLGSTTPLEQTKLAFTPFTAVPAGYHCQLLALYCQLLAHHCPLMVQECTQRAHRWPVKSVPLSSSLGVTGRSCLRRLNFPDLASWQVQAWTGRPGRVEAYREHGNSVLVAA